MLGTFDEQETLRNWSKRAEQTQSVIFGVLFIVGTFVLYEDAWVGTGGEILALFMLAFGLDLTSANVLSAFKKLKMPEI